jgi:hypothetical protein
MIKEGQCVKCSLEDKPLKGCEKKCERCGDYYCCECCAWITCKYCGKTVCFHCWGLTGEVYACKDCKDEAGIDVARRTLEKSGRFKILLVEDEYDT